MKILILSHDGKLGDAIVHTAFVDGALQLDPDVELQILASDSAAKFWMLSSVVARVWHFKKPGLLECIRIGLALRRERFDYIVTWKAGFRSEKTRLILLLAASRGKIMYTRAEAGTVRHVTHECRESLRHIYGDVVDGLVLRYRLDFERDRPLMLESLPCGGEMILFNMFGAEARKTIGIDDGTKLLAGLASLAPAASICLSCTDATESAARRVAALAGVPCRVVNTEKDLRSLIALCARADLIVSTDTSLVHIASALDKPVIGIYPNDPATIAEWGPISSRNAIVVALRERSVDAIPVMEVLDKVRNLRETMQPPVEKQSQSPMALD